MRELRELEQATCETLVQATGARFECRRKAVVTLRRPDDSDPRLRHPLYRVTCKQHAKGWERTGWTRVE